MWNTLLGYLPNGINMDCDGETNDTNWAFNGGLIEREITGFPWTNSGTESIGFNLSLH